MHTTNIYSCKSYRSEYLLNCVLDLDDVIESSQEDPLLLLKQRSRLKCVDCLVLVYEDSSVII